MNTVTNPSGIRWRSQALAVCQSNPPSAGRLTHDPIAATAAAPARWDTGVVGPAACWSEGTPRRIKPGPLHYGHLWIAWRRLEAAAGFATVELAGLRVGPVYVRSLLVACVDGLSCLQIEGRFGGEELRPGLRMRVADFEIQVGAGLPRSDADPTVCGLAIAAPGEPVLRLAYARADRDATSSTAQDEGTRR